MIKRRIFLCLWIATLACNQDKGLLIQEKVDERVKAFVTQKNNDCREALMELAERTVDSLILLEAQQSLLDSLSRMRPNRPYQPPAVPPIDSTKVAPLREL